MIMIIAHWIIIIIIIPNPNGELSPNICWCVLFVLFCSFFLISVRIKSVNDNLPNPKAFIFSPGLTIDQAIISICQHWNYYGKLSRKILKLFNSKFNFPSLNRNGNWNKSRQSSFITGQMANNFLFWFFDCLYLVIRFLYRIFYLN